MTATPSRPSRRNRALRGAHRRFDPAPWEPAPTIAGIEGSTVSDVIREALADHG